LLAPRHFQKNPFNCGALSAGTLNCGSLLAQTFSKKHLAGNFQKTFGGKISKEHLAGTCWQEHFGGKVEIYFFHFENSTKCSFLK
jgi:hypothetical protein